MFRLGEYKKTYRNRFRVREGFIMKKKVCFNMIIILIFLLTAFTLSGCGQKASEKSDVFILNDKLTLKYKVILLRFESLVNPSKKTGTRPCL